MKTTAQALRRKLVARCISKIVQDYAYGCFASMDCLAHLASQVNTHPLVKHFMQHGEVSRVILTPRMEHPRDSWSPYMTLVVDIAYADALNVDNVYGQIDIVKNGINYCNSCQVST